jgi:2-dehydro-3-deoxygluconokinase
MPGVLTLGETMALFSAVDAGSLAQVDNFRLSMGGAESNVAIGLARLGTPAMWIGRVGSDETGARVLRELRAEGVSVSATVDPEAPTGLMVKSRFAPQLVHVLYHRRGSAGSRLSPADITPALIRSADLLHISGITPALSPSASAAIEYAVDVAVEAGTPVSFDVNHRASLWSADEASDCYRRLASRSTLVFAGEDEARILVDADGPERLAAAICELGPQQAVIKLGAEGCVALIDGVAYSHAAVAVEVVDTVGAGDAFVAGYLSELMAAADPAARLETAVRCGAFACLGTGDWESFPHRANLGLLAGGDPVQR